jgi:uncharacterized SAM-binding protein YcdF (DUF218 family)
MSKLLLRSKAGIYCLLLGAVAWMTVLATQLHHHAQQPIDAVLVLGGSIRREIVASEMVVQGNRLPILISQGSQPPCIRALFDRISAPVETVWLETCAESTFDNYRYSLPTLKQWNSRHVQVVTSPTHLPRAQWLATIMLGSHGLWPEMQLVQETGVPGNVESSLKTGLDVVRSLVWAIVSQVYQPVCPHVFPLQSVDLADWNQQSFKCEHQAKIDPLGVSAPKSEGVVELGERNQGK